MTPAVRRLLREHGLEAAQVAGTGGGGRITREDVLAYVEAARTGAAPPRRARGSRRAGAVAATAAAPAAAKPAAAGPDRLPAGRGRGPRPDDPDAQGHRGADDTGAPGPARLRPDGGRRHAASSACASASSGLPGAGGRRLSFVPFVVKAAAEALKRNPTFNAHWTDEGLLAKRRINIGVAVAVDDGLIVPVIRDADQLSIHGLNLAIADVADRARANKLRLDDFGGGTFTVDNTGYLGTNLVMPIINVPEVGIVTMEAITKRAVVVETPRTATSSRSGSIMNMVLAIDHRANDGAGGRGAPARHQGLARGRRPGDRVY